MITSPYTALMGLPGGQLLTVGRWPVPSEAQARTSPLAWAGISARLLAVEPSMARRRERLRCDIDGGSAQLTAKAHSARPHWACTPVASGAG